MRTQLIRLLAVLALAAPVGLLTPPASSQVRGVDGWLYFVSTGGSSTGEIWRTRPGRPETAEPLTQAFEDDRPAVSPDGRTVVFRRIVDPGDTGLPPVELWMMDADGANQHKVDVAGLRLSSATFSPDGRTLALSASGGTTFNLWTSSVSGSRIRPLLDWDVAAQLQPTAPTFTPDGTRLLFLATRSGSTTRDLASVRIDGTDRRWLTDDTRTEQSVDVSPDGRTVAFIAQDAGPSVRRLWLMNADGSSRREVPLDSEPGQVRWAPDGKALVVVTVTSSQRVVLVKPSTGEATLASPGAGPDVQEREGVVGPTPTRCDGRWATIVGSPAGETITGSIGNDVIVGGAGADRIDGLSGDDAICAGTGNDVVTGGTGVDRLFGQGGYDTLRAKDSRKDGRIDCGADKDPAAGRDAGRDPAAVSCNP